MKTRAITLIAVFVSLCWLLSTTITKPATSLVNNSAKAWQEVADATVDLQQILDAEPTDWTAAEEKFAEARLAFKQCETLLWYFNRQYTNQYLNGAPLPYLEENSPQLSILQPQGLQRLEELIGEQDNAGSLSMLQNFTRRWNDLRASLGQVKLTDRMVLEALRQEVIRVAFLEITGFENPAFTDAIQEAAAAWKGIEPIVEEYARAASEKDIRHDLQKAVKRGNELLASGEFETFDRMTFIREAAQPLYGALVDVQVNLNIEWYDETGQMMKPLKDRSRYLFSTELIDPYFFTALMEEEDSEELRQLGKYLFFDPVLSSNGQRSCASCHNPDLAFTDGAPLSVAMDFEGTVDRNAPTLVNAVYAESFFYDLRTRPLENQFEHVVFNHKEFNTSYAEISNRLNQSLEYRQLFQQAFGSDKTEINNNTIITALASYVASLRTFNSPVDAYLRGEDVAVSDEVRLGFNLFMGKASCGTCHFAPTFAGLVPPYFDDTESEILGVPATAANKELDTDPGRAGGVLKQDAPIYKHSFKTVTVRNIALTAPYMHNGIYDSLEQVMDFYNVGGGVGFGYEVPFQTLPFDSLSLTDAETKAIIAFMEALTDTSGITRVPERLPKFENEELDEREIGGVY
jgi:cytochrome c peroxidase